MSDKSQGGGVTAKRGASIVPSALPLDRFIAFSDGVFAIAITILVLELVAPSASVPLLPALEELWPDFLGYFISFVYIGGAWLSHARMTNLMRRGDPVAYGVNLIMLLFVAVLPFTTRVLITHLAGPDLSLAALCYGLNVLIGSLLLSLLMFYVAANPELVVDDVADHELKGIYRRRWGAIVVIIFAIILAFVAPSLAVALYLVAALVFLALPLLGLFRPRRNAAR